MQSKSYFLYYLLLFVEFSTNIALLVPSVHFVLESIELWALAKEMLQALLLPHFDPNNFQNILCYDK